MSEAISLPPTQDELPYDDGEPMESARHQSQMNLLIASLYSWLEHRPDGYVAGNMGVYFSLAQVRNQDFRAPDFFLVLDVPKHERKSWVVWEEGKGPDVVIELLSESTAAVDKGRKKTIYQKQLKVSEYFWYDPFAPDDLVGFKLNDGVYDRLPLNQQQHLVSPLLKLALARWRGVYENIEATWLRWATLEGDLLPTRAEAEALAATAAKQETLAAKQEALAAKQEALAAKQEASAAKQRAAEAEAEVARLQALLQQQNQQ